MPELMSPAGNLSSFIAAVNSGADSVYLGLDKFNARRPAQNFAPFIMRKVVNYAHAHNCKVYVTLNIQLKPSELSQACEMLKFIKNIGVDAVIATDLAVIDVINKFFPEIELHFSTQTVVQNALEVQFAAEQGAKRVVLARELTLDEISKCVETAKANNIEIEIFTEGSMCFCVSGRCLMSSFIGGRSGNRGACTGCCRVKWTSQTNEVSSIFSMKDLSLASRLSEIINCGVTALKIEGRLKKSGWVGAITSIYRNILDKKNDVDINKLAQYTAREVGTGHVFGHEDIVGNNENWQNYIKTTDDVAIPSEFDDILVITVSNTEKLDIFIEYRGQSCLLQEEIPSLPKKAKTVNLGKVLKEKLEENLIDFETDISVKISDLECGLSFLNKFAEKIKKECDKLKNLSDKYPEINCEISDFIKQIPVERIRKRQLGSMFNKIIVKESSLSNYKNNQKIDTVVVYLEPNSSNQNILNKKIENLIIALPEIIYQHEIQYYSQRLKSLVDSGFDKFEANSWCGIKLLQQYNVKKYAGVGLSVMNHKAAEYLQKLGFSSCYLSSESDISVYKAMSSFVSGEIELNCVEFAKIPLFISRVDATKFANKTFHDKYIELKANPYGDVNYFTPDSNFCLIDKQTLQDKIFVDNLVADLRFFDKPFDVLQKVILNQDYGKVDTFNYRRKLV